MHYLNWHTLWPVIYFLCSDKEFYKCMCLMTSKPTRERNCKCIVFPKRSLFKCEERQQFPPPPLPNTFLISPSWQTHTRRERTTCVPFQTALLGDNKFKQLRTVILHTFTTKITPCIIHVFIRKSPVCFELFI